MKQNRRDKCGHISSGSTCGPKTEFCIANNVLYLQRIVFCIANNVLYLQRSVFCIANNVLYLQRFVFCIANNVLYLQRIVFCIANNVLYLQRIVFCIANDVLYLQRIVFCIANNAILNTSESSFGKKHKLKIIWCICGIFVCNTPGMFLQKRGKFREAYGFLHKPASRTAADATVRAAFGGGGGIKLENRLKLVGAEYWGLCRAEKRDNGRGRLPPLFSGEK